MNINRLHHLLSPKGKKAEVLRKTKITRPTLESILNGGDFKVSNLEKIADALNVPVSYFFEDEKPVEKNEQDIKDNHGEIYQNVKQLDKRVMVEPKKVELEEVEEVTEEIKLPDECPESVRHIIESLSLKLDAANRLIAEKERMIKLYEKMIEK